MAGRVSQIVQGVVAGLALPVIAAGMANGIAQASKSWAIFLVAYLATLLVVGVALFFHLRRREELRLWAAFAITGLPWCVVVGWAMGVLGMFQDWT